MVSPVRIRVLSPRKVLQKARLACLRPGARKRRSDKRFCDDACRQAHLRARKKAVEREDAVLRLGLTATHLRGLNLLVRAFKRVLTRRYDIPRRFSLIWRWVTGPSLRDGLERWGLADLAIDEQYDVGVGVEGDVRHQVAVVDEEARCVKCSSTAPRAA